MDPIKATYGSSASPPRERDVVRARMARYGQTISSSRGVIGLWAKKRAGGKPHSRPPRSRGANVLARGASGHRSAADVIPSLVCGSYSRLPRTRAPTVFDRGSSGHRSSADDTPPPNKCPFLPHRIPSSLAPPLARDGAMGARSRLRGRATIGRDGAEPVTLATPS